MRATRANTAGQRYLDLQREARRTGRPTDELVQLYALECFLDRLGRSSFAERFVLKGGVLLAALRARRPTRDIDFSARALSNETDEMLATTRVIAAIDVDDGLMFHTSAATAESIREADQYSGVRITLGGSLSRALIRLHVDINFGDPIWPSAQRTVLPRILGGTLTVHGYPLEMVLAEKLVTVLARGSANTRWRDFVDIYTLARNHDIDGETLGQSIRRVATHREIALVSLVPTLAGYAALAQPRWQAWLRKQKLVESVPADFQRVIDFVVAFAEPLLTDAVTARRWNSQTRHWTS